MFTRQFENLPPLIRVLRPFAADRADTRRSVAIGSAAAGGGGAAGATLHVPYGELKHSGSATMSAFSRVFARSTKETARRTFVALSSPTASCTRARRRAESEYTIHSHRFDMYSEEEIGRRCGFRDIRFARHRGSISIV